MMKHEWIYYGVMFFGVFIASISQLLLKTAAQKTYRHWIYQYLNVRVIFGYGIMLVSTVCTVIAMRQVPLSTTPVWNSLGIIFAALWGRVIFHEKMHRKKKIGLLIVIVGIVIFSIQ